jgi:predicted transcriptional regulator
MSLTADTEDTMRQPADWMVPSDDRILELLRQEGNLTPQAVEDFGGPVAGHASNRLPVLARYGLVTKISRGLYRITEEGEAYLDENLDASDLEPAED